MSKCIGGQYNLFEEKKAQLNPLQVGLAASVMPKTPPMPAAKYSDLGLV